MSKQAWSRMARLGAAATVALVATMSYLFDHDIADRGGYREAVYSSTAHLSASGWLARTAEPDASDDGHIIIECLGFSNNVISSAETAPPAQAIKNANSVSEASALSILKTGVPHYPLEPAKCWPKEHKRV